MREDEPSPQLIALDYRSRPKRDVPLPNPLLLRSALGFAIAPLLGGTVVFLAWLSTRHMAFQILGLGVIIAGLASVASGGICATVFVVSIIRQPAIAKYKRSLWLVVLSSILLLANFPVCGLILNEVDFIENHLTLVIENKSSAALAGMSASHGYETTNLGPLAPGAKVSKQIHVSAGRLNLSVTRHDQTEMTTTLSSYLDGDSVAGGNTVYSVVVTDGTITLDDGRQSGGN